jgi:anthranilate synthase component 2
VIKLLVYDNYDSFTYNLVHLLEKIAGERVAVACNDQIAVAELSAYDKILLSPGPGIPEEAGGLLAVIAEWHSTKSILGVCLGHQAIGQAFGAKLINPPEVYHGIAEDAHFYNTSTGLFAGLHPIEKVGRYHSWLVGEEHWPACLEVTCRDRRGNIMGLRHRDCDVQGIQFHPESVLTPCGEKIIANWLKG